MNYLQTYINSIPLKIPMAFGINKGVILNEIDISERKKENGESNKKFCFLELIKLDENDKPIGREEFGFFRLDSKNLSFAQNNFFSLFNKLFYLSSAMFNGDDEAFEGKISEIFTKIYGKEGYDILDEADELFKHANPIKNKKKPKQKDIELMVESLNTNVGVLFYELLKDKVGIGKSPKMEILSVIDKKGYKGLPQEDEWVSLEEDILKLDVKYLRYKEASEKPDTADDDGEEYSEENMEDITDDDDDAGAGDLDSMDFDDDDDIVDEDEKDLDDIDY